MDDSNKLNLFWFNFFFFIFSIIFFDAEYFELIGFSKIIFYISNYIKDLSCNFGGTAKIIKSIFFLKFFSISLV